MTNLTSIAGKLAKYIRLLASDKDGEVVAAARTMERALKSIGADFHCLAERVESPSGEVSETEMEKIYSAGIAEGRRLEKQARDLSHMNYNGKPQFPSGKDMAIFCYQKLDNITSEWEHEFITNMASWTRTRPLSAKQQAHLEKIYVKLGGRV